MYLEFRTPVAENMGKKNFKLVCIYSADAQYNECQYNVSPFAYRKKKGKEKL